MNDNFIMTRIESEHGAEDQPARRRIEPAPNDQIDQQPLSGRALPLSDRRRNEDGACRCFKGEPPRQPAENLLWALYNKVDFVFNY